MATRVTPTFLLKGVEQQKLISDYQQGYFSVPRKKSKIIISEDTPILDKIYSTSNSEPIFSFKDNYNNNIIIATTGHDDFEIYTRSGGKLQEGGRCNFCRQDFTEIAIGYPIKQQELSILTRNEKDQEIYRNIYVFWVDGKFCKFSCALAHIRNMLAKSSEYRDPTMSDSERLLKQMYKLVYPNSGVLRPSQDPNLLKINGGSLTKEEWENEKHVYIRTDKIIMQPVKVEYVQKNFLNPVVSIDYTRDIMSVTSRS